MHGVLPMQVPEERNKDGQWVPKGSKPVLQLTHQQVGAPRRRDPPPVTAWVWPLLLLM